MARRPTSNSDRGWGSAGAGPLLLLCLLIAAFVVHAVYLRCVAEDAFISFRFATHLAEGHGPVWNVGEEPVEGYTNFLWVVVGAMVLRSGLDLPLVAQILGAAAGVGVLLLTYRLGRRALGLGAYVALLPVCLLAVSGPLATWSTSGMETVPFTLLCLAGVGCALRGLRTGGRGALVLAALCFVLASLTRPEGAMLAALTAGVVWWRGRGRLHRAPMALALAAYLLPCAAFFLWRLDYYGLPLPNTFYAKTGGGGRQLTRGAIYLGYFAFHYLLPWLPAALVAWWERGRGRAVADERARGTAILLCGAIVGLYCAYVVVVGGDYMAMYRFFVPVLPFLYLLLGSAVARLRMPAVARLSRGVAVAASLLLAAGGTLLHSTPLETALFSTPPFQHGNYQGVQTERWHVARLAAIGRFFAGYARHPDDSLATRAIGAVGYYSGLRIYDLYGLTDTHLARQKPRHESSGPHWAGHEKGDLLHTLSRRPTYILVGRGVGGRTLQMKDAIARLERFVAPGSERRVERILRHRYRLTRARIDDAETGTRGYLTFLERRGRPEERVATTGSGPLDPAAGQ